MAEEKTELVGKVKVPGLKVLPGFTVTAPLGVWAHILKVLNGHVMSASGGELLDMSSLNCAMLISLQLAKQRSGGRRGGNKGKRPGESAGAGAGALRGGEAAGR